MEIKHFWNKLRKLRKDHPVKWGMVIDLDKCTGCMSCMQACRNENNVAYAGEDQMDKRRGIFWLDRFMVNEAEEEEAGMKFTPTPCNQCLNARCIRYCPTRATETSDEGVTGQVYARCIGCRYCTVACPYTRRYFNWLKPNIPKEMEPMMNPDVEIRYKGIVEKCNYCYQRIIEAKWNAKLENRPIRDGEIQMACEQTCPSGAITFGNLQDVTSRVYKLARKKRAIQLMPEVGTQPKQFFLQEEDVHVK